MTEGNVTAPPPPPPPPPPAPPSPPAPQGYDFVRPFAFVFDDPRWLPKILIGGLFYLLGFLLIGFVFILGYQARLARNVIAGVQHPLPEWDDLGEYFGEGLRLVGVVLLWVAPLAILTMFFIVPAAFLSELNNEALEAAGGCVVAVVWALMVPLSLAVTFFLPASLLMAIVEKRFGAAFEFDQIWQFIKNNISDYLLAIVIYFVARFAGGLGFILFCIGVIFTAFWAMCITTHAFAQVYRRGRV
ncbi:MAG TPA: DUF4013 domain-containing protein [Thermoanaerobaculia bacterium]|nr:DUF4013 domain-containing protein [Thermoanaerobaculia bacterium]